MGVASSHLSVLHPALSFAQSVPPVLSSPDARLAHNFRTVSFPQPVRVTRQLPHRKTVPTAASSSTRCFSRYKPLTKLQRYVSNSR